MCWSPDVGDGLLVQYQLRVVRLAAGLVGVEGQHFGSVASISDQVSQERVLCIFYIPIIHILSLYMQLYVFRDRVHHTYVSRCSHWCSEIEYTIPMSLHTCFCGECFYTHLKLLRITIYTIEYHATALRVFRPTHSQS